MGTRIGILYELAVILCHLCLLSVWEKCLSLKRGLKSPGFLVLWLKVNDFSLKPPSHGKIGEEAREKLSKASLV